MILDYLNRRYGKLVVIKWIEYSNGHNKGGLLLCRCDCGKEVEKHGYYLSSRRSCGCLQREARLRGSSCHRTYEKSTINYQYTFHKHAPNTKRNGFLNKEDWLKIVFLPCHYCGCIDTRNCAESPSYIKKCGKTLTPEITKRYEIKMNGIDRVDSKIGYIVGNCVACCGMCNIMKNGFTQNDFFEKIKKICLVHDLINGKL